MRRRHSVTAVVLLLALAALVWWALRDAAVPAPVAPAPTRTAEAVTQSDGDSAPGAERHRVRVAHASPGDEGVAQEAPAAEPAEAARVAVEEEPRHENLPDGPAAIGELVGRVLLYPDRSPIEGAMVRLSWGAPGRDVVPYPDPDRATTGPNGVFRIAGFAPGTYSLDVTWAGRAPRQLRVAITADQPPEEVEVLFGAGGNVAGRVERADGPAAGVAVRINPSGLSGGKGLLSCSTDAAGEYRFEDLPSGTYGVEVDGGGAGARRTGSVTVTAGETARLDFRSDAFVTGVVRWDGAPLPDAIVRARRDGGEYRSEQSRSKEDGSFRVDGLEPGQHVITVQVLESPGFAVDAARAELTAGENRIDLLLGQGDAAGSVAGRLVPVVPPSAPLSRVQITICAMTEKAADVWETGGQVAMAFANADGEFRVLGLPAGRYHLDARPMGIGLKSASVEFTLAPAERKSGIEVRMEAREPRETPPSISVLTGAVTDGGRPLADAHVRAFPAAGGGSLRQTVTDGTGHFVLDRLEPGMWRVHVQVLGEGGFSAEVAEKEIVAGKNAIEVRVGEGDLAGEIRGRVTARVSGEALTAKDVVLWLAARDGEEQGRHVGLTSPDASGSFRFRCVPGGSYRILATPRGGALRAREVDVDVVAGRVLERVEVALEPLRTGTVQFVLRTEDDQPVRRAKILSMLDGKPRQGSMTTNSDSGVFETHLEIGTHTVELGDWTDSIRAQVTIDVREGETTVVRAVLRPSAE